jgi:hypothetical protein
MMDGTGLLAVEEGPIVIGAPTRQLPMQRRPYSGVPKAKKQNAGVARMSLAAALEKSPLNLEENGNPELRFPTPTYSSAQSLSLYNGGDLTPLALNLSSPS